MKKLILIIMGISALASAAVAAPVLVYPDESGLRSGKFVLGILSDDGVLVPASQVDGAAKDLILGFFTGDLSRGTLIRLDNELDVALLRAGDAITSGDLLKIHQKKVAGIQGFLPSQIELRSDLGFSPAAKSSVQISTIPFQLKIDGMEVGEEPVVLKKFRRESAAKLELVKLSTPTAWKVEVDIQAEPAHLFWKKGESKTLTRVPKSTFHFGQQMMFSPMGPGDSLKFSLELSGIKSEQTEWTVLVKTKQEDWEKKIKIRFE